MSLRDRPASFAPSQRRRMSRTARRLSFLAAFIYGLAAGGAVAQTSLARQPASAPGDTDVNVVTAIDVSDSVGRHEEWLQQTGLARAVIAPAFLESVAAGSRRRIGFAAFAWSSDGRFEMVVPWTVIASAEDAHRVSQAIAAADLIDRSSYGGGDTDAGTRPPRPVLERRTDVSAAIDFAASLLGSAPQEAGRSVMNILADGMDNVSGGAAAARDRALDAGYTINGVAVGHTTGDLVEYFKANVIGGFGSFVMPLADPAKAGEIMARKLMRDLLA